MSSDPGYVTHPLDFVQFWFDDRPGDADSKLSFF